MMPIRFNTKVDNALASAMPPLRPLLGRNVEMTARVDESNEAKSPHHRLSPDELFARRIDATKGGHLITQADIDHAIVTGALDADV